MHDQRLCFIMTQSFGVTGTMYTHTALINMILLLSYTLDVNILSYLSLSQCSKFQQIVQRITNWTWSKAFEIHFRSHLTWLSMLVVLNLFSKHKNILAFAVFFNTGMSHIVDSPNSWKTRTYLYSYIVKTMVAENLATTGAGASAAMVLPFLSQNSPITAWQELKLCYTNH